MTSNYNELFNFLEETETTYDKIYETIWDWDDDDLAKYVDVLNMVIRRECPDRLSNTQNTFMANTELSGGGYPCSFIKCRLNKIDQLARNTIMYADRTYIQNPFLRYNHHHTFSDLSRRMLIEDIQVMTYIRPLLESGLFAICTDKHNFCSECYNNLIRSKVIPKEEAVLATKDFVRMKFARQVKYYVEESNGEIVIVCKGPEDIMDHETILIWGGKSNELINERFIEGKSTRLSEKDVKKLGIPDFFSTSLLDDMLMNAYYGTVNKASYVTTREVDFEILLRSEQIPENKIKTDLLKNITHGVPIIPQVSFDALIEMREKEGESFLVYRDAMNKLVRDNSLSTKDEIESAFADYIKPELNRIDLSISNSKKILKKKLKKDLFVGSTLLTIGCFSGLIPPSAAGLIAGAGSPAYAIAMSNHLQSLLNKSEKVEGSEFYFLWKILDNWKNLG